MRRNRIVRAIVMVGALAGVLSVSAWTPSSPARPRPASARGEDDAIALLHALRVDLDGILRSAASNWRRSHWSVLAVSIDRGDTLFAMTPSDALAPASNLKLLTTSTALQRLGPDFRYQTFLMAAGPVVGGRLQGDLILYGTGDPGLSDRFHPTGLSVLEAFADSLAALGVVTVEGDLVGDGSYFSGPLLGEGWSPEDLNDAFAAASSALSYNENVFTLRLKGTDSFLDVLTLPENAGVPIVDQTGATGSGLMVRREHPTQPIVVTGSIPAGGREVWRELTVPDPAHFTASVFRGILEQRGIQVLGATRSADEVTDSRVTGRKVWAPTRETTKAPRVLARHVSPPLHEYLTVVNKKSHNLLADQIFKTLGRVLEGDGSFAGGSRAVTSFLTGTVGLDSASLVVYDGSGLSAFNRVSAADFVALLSYMSDQPSWDAFWATLPEAGNPRELRRMGGTSAAGNLRAKTGTIRSVSALSGVVRTTNGERVAFSIISNEVPSTGGVKRIEDRIGTRLAAFGRPLGSVGAASATIAMANEANPEPTALGGDEGNVTPAVESTSDQPAADVPAAPPATHRVQAGENFSVIAKRYGVSVDALQEANSKLSPKRLQVGTTLTIPSARARP